VLTDPADDGLPLHAAVSRARAAVAMMAVAVRGHGRRVRRMLSFITSFSAG
jgi:hypothetical protein